MPGVTVANAGPGKRLCSLALRWAILTFAIPCVLSDGIRVYATGLAVSINFQRTNSANTTGYLPDVGYTFGERGNGYAYGWNEDNTANAFERNQYPNKTVDTGNKLQPGGQSRYWEIAVPNGIYDVRLVAADPAVTNGNDGTRYSIMAEGVAVITNDVPIPTWWVRGWLTHVQVRVTDRRLTISNGPTATNNSIAFVEIKQVAPVFWGAAAVIDNTDTNKSPADYLSETSPGVLGYFEGHAGKKLAILGWGLNWWSGSGYAPFRWQTNYMAKMWARGTIPYFSWMPQGPSGDTNFSLQNIINGKHDAYLSNFAAQAKAYSKPFFLRFAWEMNGTWSSYGEGIGYNTNCPPGSFTNMWRHVHDVFTRVGCSNVTWIWCIDRDITNQWHFGPVSRFYPGPDYVDWVGFDSYNRTGESLESIFATSYNTLLSLAPGKPIMSETAGYPRGGPSPIDSKPAWIGDALAQVPVLFPQIKAFMWWNWHDWSIDSRNNLPIEGGDNWLPYWEAPVDWASVTAFSNGIASVYYLPNVFTNSKTSPIQPIDLLNPPASVSVSISNGAARLVWSLVKGATNYNVYRSTTGENGSFNWVARTSETNWSDATTVYGSRYYYTIAAENLAGESVDSAAVNVTIPRPTLRAQVTPTNTLLVSWPLLVEGFALESRADSFSANWQAVFAPVTVVSGYNEVTVSMRERSQFFRLTYKATAAGGDTPGWVPK